MSFNATFLCILRLVFSLFGDMVFCVFLCQVIFIRVLALRGSPPREHTWTSLGHSRVTQQQQEYALRLRGEELPASILKQGGVVLPLII